ncbi:hypothetical protein [Cetobacterium sp.]|uniref:hypothetical protein n=3 Tax=Cetobacterium sp. TaxID=2071632 RepID=UPI003F30E167
MKILFLFFIIFKLSLSYINIHPTFFDKPIDFGGSYQEFTLFNDTVLYRIYCESYKDSSNKDMKDIPVKLFFSNNEKNIILTKNTTSTDIFCYFKINNDSDAIGTYYLNDINKTSREFSLKIDFSDNSILKNNQLFTFSNYEITPLALFNYTTNIYTTSIGINKEDNVHFTRANFWFSRPEIINSPNIFSIEGAFSNSFLLSLGTGRKGATFETFDGTPIKPLSSTSSNILNNSYFQIKFSKESDSFKYSFYRRDENIKKVIVKIGWILSEDTIVINYFNEPPKFNLQVQKHMEFGYISKVLILLMLKLIF